LERRLIYLSGGREVFRISNLPPQDRRGGGQLKFIEAFCVPKRGDRSANEESRVNGGPGDDYESVTYGLGESTKRRNGVFFRESSKKTGGDQWGGTVR